MLRSNLCLPTSGLCFLRESDVAVTGWLLLFGRAPLQDAVEHVGAFGAAGGELRVGLFVQAAQAMEFVGDVERGEDGHLERINRERARRDFAHPAINKLSELRHVLAVAV